MISFLIYCNVKFDLKNNFFSENLTSATTRSDGSSHPKTLVVDNYETQTQNYAIGLSVDENDVDMQSQNTVFSLLNALGVYIFFLILGWASIGEGH